MGSLFMNFGGPGAPMAAYIEAYGTTLFPNLSQHFDLVGVDPRGVGESQPSIDCKANQENLGIYSEPFPTPFTANENQLVNKDNKYISKCVQNNPGVLQFVSTANVARDFDNIRAAMGEKQLNYFGFSYGTFLGATYASLFPKNYRAMVLDGPVDANRYINDPMQDLSAQTAGFEKALDRFLAACKADQTACAGFGGADPEAAYDNLIDQTTTHAAAGQRLHGGPASGQGRRLPRGGAVGALQQGLLAGVRPRAGRRPERRRLRHPRDRRRRLLRPQPRRHVRPGRRPLLHDRRGRAELRQEPRPVYMHAGEQAWDQFPHFWLNNGYVELNYGLYPVKAKDAFYGPFKVPNNSPTPLVVATTYDPATPYHGALRLVNDLGNARLLTMVGDGHTAYGNGSDCIDSDIENYLNTLALPAPGTKCVQNLPFAQPTASPQVQSLATKPAIVARYHDIKGRAR